MAWYPAGPALIYDARLWRVHYKQDQRYGKPKAYAFFNVKQSNSLFGLSSTPRLSAIGVSICTFVPVSY
jgi:hypothetical protein